MGTLQHAKQGDYVIVLLGGKGGGLQSAFRKIGVPEPACGDGTPGPPGSAEAFEFFGRGAFAEALHFLDGGGEGEIARRTDVRAAQRNQEINVGGTAADAFESDEHLVRGLIGNCVKAAKVE